MPTYAELGRYLQRHRKHVRLSQTAVASQLGVTRQVVSAFESGKRPVSSKELQILCNLLRVYPNDLLGFSHDEEDESLASSLDFRMNAGIFELSENDKSEVKEMIDSQLPNRDTYLARWSTSTKKYSSNKRAAFWSMQQLADDLRKGFGQTEPPVNIYLMAERLGVYVKPTFLDKAAAVVNRADVNRNSPPWILVSSTQPVDRQRYSIGHEIVHLVLHDEDLIVHHPHYYRRHFDQREIDAESFAAELLMPQDLVKESITRLKAKDPVEESVFLLSYLYQVSFAAMSKRLYELNLITRTILNHLGMIKPSKLEGAVKKQAVKYPFKPEKFIPELTKELGVLPKPQAFDQKAVRRMQEMAYTRYLGLQARGSSNANAVYGLESPGRVYEKVAIWIATHYPMTRQLA